MRKQIGSIAGMIGLAIIALAFAGRERVAYAEGFASDKYCGSGPGLPCRTIYTEVCDSWVYTTVGGGLTGSPTGGGANGTATRTCAQWTKTTTFYYWTESGTGGTTKAGSPE